MASLHILCPSQASLAPYKYISKCKSDPVVTRKLPGIYEMLKARDRKGFRVSFKGNKRVGSRSAHLEDVQGKGIP